MKIWYFFPVSLFGFIFCAMLAQGAEAEKQGVKLEPFPADRATSSAQARQPLKPQSFEPGAGFIGIGVANEFQAQEKERLRRALGLDPNQPGALVLAVMPGGPAARAGVRKGDLVIAIDGTPIKDADSLMGYTGKQKMGATIKLTLLRPRQGASPKRLSVAVRIAPRPGREELAKALRKQSAQPSPVSNAAELGLAVEPDTRQGKLGLRITAIKSKSFAERAGLQVGDLLLAINKVPLQTALDIPRAIATRPGKPALIAYLRQGSPALVAIDVH